ncbi:hypothetical protein MHB46_22995 [Paenibacillus sp. FSL H7-0703]|uniref:hypothetical protein n=1 Tax=Paenibacillus sp. FSL H7-0703 TaxID=2921438 RepID=UPI0030F5CD04
MIERINECIRTRTWLLVLIIFVLPFFLIPIVAGTLKVGMLISDFFPNWLIVMKINTEDIVSISTFIYYYTCFLAIEVTALLSYAVYKFSVNKDEKDAAEQKSKEKEFDQKLKVHLDNYIEYSFASLMYFIPDLHGNQLPSRNEFFREVTYFRIALEEINKIPITSVPSKYVEAISNVKLLYQIIDAELERIFKNYDNPEKLANELNRIEIKRRTLKIIEHYSQIASDKDLWIKVIKELEEAYKQSDKNNNIR